MNLKKIKRPNQPHLLNKYIINMGFSHFHEFGILSGMYTILVLEMIGNKWKADDGLQW